MKRTATLALLEENSNDCDDPSTSSTAKKDKPKRNCTNWKTMLKKTKFNLECCWKDCKFTNEDVDCFVEHVVTHVKDLRLVQLDEQYFDNYVYKCDWGECTYTMDSVTEAQMHISYHGYYKYLTAIGAALLAQDDFPKCKRSSIFKDCIPEEICQARKLRCGWGDCDEECSNPYRFYCHVRCHANYASGSGSKAIRCEWKLCNYTSRKNSTLIIHMQVHTLEKAIACPTCGYGYANNTKFLDHCVRQIKDKSYQCPKCQKCFSSDRILRDHVRQHTKLYQCPFCPYVNAVPSGLSMHVRRQHMIVKNFSCSLCEMKTKTKNNLLEHMKVHFSDPAFKCNIGDCTFSCRSRGYFNKHKFDVHGEGKLRYYTCHVCNKQIYHLTTFKIHLRNMHKVVIEGKLSFTEDAEGHYYLDPSCTTKTHADQLFIAYDQVDAEGNIISNVFVKPAEKDESQTLSQVLILPREEGQPELQTLKAVAITSNFPPMFIMQNDIDQFKAANKDVTSLQIKIASSEAPLENQ